MLIVNETEILENNTKIDVMLTEIVKTLIPESFHKMFREDAVRQNMLKKFGESAFLDFKNLKYPVVNPKTGEYDCKLIYAARVRALQNKEKDIANKAKELYETNSCNVSIGVEISEHESKYDICDLLELLNS